MTNFENIVRGKETLAQNLVRYNNSDDMFYTSDNERFETNIEAVKHEIEWLDEESENMSKYKYYEFELVQHPVICAKSKEEAEQKIKSEWLEYNTDEFRNLKEISKEEYYKTFK